MTDGTYTAKSDTETDRITVRAPVDLIEDVDEESRGGTT